MATTMNDIEARARKYAEAREKLAAIAAELNAGIAALKREHMASLRRAVGKAAEHHDTLLAMIEASPELFTKPRTVTLHGIRIGYAKGKGGIAYDDADAVVLAIQKLLPDQAETLIRWTGKPVKEALNGLDVATLRKLGCRVEDTGDQIVIRPADSAVDKMVDALLKDATASSEV